MQRAGQDDSFGVTREMAYDGDMDDITDPADALGACANCYTALESRQMSVNQGGTDVTTREIAVLRREIEQLKRTLSRLSRLGVNEKPGLVV